MYVCVCPRARACVCVQLFRYATAFDWLCFFLGVLGEGWVGSAQALMMILFGDLLDAVGRNGGGGDELTTQTDEIALKIVFLGIINLICAWVASVGFKTSGLRQCSMWKKAYLTAILRQDVGWFDVSNPSELSSLVASETAMIEDGLSSKMSMGVRALFQAVSSLVVGFYFCWDVALVSLATSPIGAYGGYIMANATTKGAKEVADAYAKAGSTAGETLSELRTVAALGAEQKQAEKYAASLEQSRAAGVRKGTWSGFANGMLFGGGNMGTAIAFLYAGHKIAQQLRDTELTLVSFPHPFEADKELHPNCQWHGMPGTEALVTDPCPFSGGKVVIALFCVTQGFSPFLLSSSRVTCLSPRSPWPCLALERHSRCHRARGAYLHLRILFRQGCRRWA